MAARNPAPWWNSSADAMTVVRFASSFMACRRLKSHPSVHGIPINPSCRSLRIVWRTSVMEHVARSDHRAGDQGLQLGDRPVWTIEVEQPFHVPALRKLLKPAPGRSSRATSPSSTACFWTATLACTLPSPGTWWTSVPLGGRPQARNHRSRGWRPLRRGPDGALRGEQRPVDRTLPGPLHRVFL